MVVALSIEQQQKNSTGPGAELKYLVRLGMDELVALARRGELRGRHVWLAMQGARTYHRAVLRGDVAGAEDQATRARQCVTCTHHRERTVVLDGQVVRAGYCGQPLSDADGQGKRGRPCGCLVTMTVDGSTVAAGRAIVASRACPLGKALGGPKWTASKRAGAQA